MTSQIALGLTELGAAVRRWRRAPGAPLATAGMLAAGIGATTAVFSAMNAALLRPLPYPAPAELVLVTSQFPNMRLDLGLSAPEALELGRLATAFSGVGLGYVDSVPVSGRDEPVVATAGIVSAGLLDVLHTPATMGRTFGPADDTPASPLVAVLGFNFWRRAFGADPAVVGRLIAIDGRAHEVIGVMPAGFDLLNRRIEIWLPLRVDPNAPGNRANHAYTVVARRRPGVSLDAARADVARAVGLWADATTEFHTPDPKFHPLRIAELTDVVRGATRQTVTLVGGAVLLVLLAASANAASLRMAQTDRRVAELAVRAALGASPRRLLAASLVEGLLLGCLATVAGAAAFAALQQAIWSQAPPALAALTPSFDWRLLLFSAALALGTGVVCGLAPYSRLRAAALAGTLTSDTRSATPSTQRQRARRVLVGFEVALALTLLSGSLLTIESLWRLTRVDAGFNPTGILRAQITLPTASYPDRARINQFYDTLEDRLRHTPGVVSVGIMSGLPPDRPTNNTSVLPEGASPAGHAGVPPVQYLQFVSPGFFETLGVSIKQGRAFADTDRSSGDPVAILNEQAARTYWPDGRVVGRRIRVMGAGLPWMTVVGVAADMRQGGLRQPPGTEIFVPHAQAANASGDPMTTNMNVVLRASGMEPASLVMPLRQAVASLDPTLAVSGIESMSEVLAGSVAAPRFVTFILGAFGAIATLLSVTGVYGVVATGVAQRRREFAIRRSLGAGAAAIAGLVLGQMRTTIGAGLAVGAVVALATSRWLLPFLFDVPAGSPGRLLATAALLAAVAALACVAPLLRALRIDPARALRGD